MGYIRDEKFLRDFGAHLAALRKSKGMTQEDLAEKANIALSSIARIETGVLNTSISSIVFLSKALGVSKKELFDF